MVAPPSTPLESIVFGLMSLCSLSTLVLVIRLSYFVGSVVQKVEGDHERITALEQISCPHVECPLKMRPILQDAVNREVQHES